MKGIIDKVQDKPVFICGHPKSGTSLVRALFDSHPQLIVYPEETVFFRSFLPEVMEKSLAEKIAFAEKRLLHIFTWNLTQPPASQKGFPDRDYANVSYEEVKQVYTELLKRDNGYRHDGDLLSAAILAFGKVTGQLTETTSCWVEKSPYNEYFVEQIIQWWPRAQFIHIVRDPRDNYLSYRRKHPSWNGETFTANWMKSTRHGLENQKRLGENRYLVICYEHLVRDPKRVVEDLRFFLNIEDHETLAIPTRNGVPWGGNSMFDLEFEGISAESVGRWKKQLSASEAGIIQIIAHPLMTTLNYELLAAIPFSAHLRSVKWKFHQYRKGLPTKI